MSDRPKTAKVQIVSQSFGYPYVLALAVVEGAMPHAFCRIGKEKITLGRLEACELVVDDPAVSGRHCAIHVRGGTFEVVDLESSNGTLLNGRPLLPKVRQQLKHMDELRLGETRILFTANRLTGVSV